MTPLPVLSHGSAAVGTPPVMNGDQEAGYPSQESGTTAGRAGEGAGLGTRQAQDRQQQQRSQRSVIAVGLESRLAECLGPSGWPIRSQAGAQLCPRAAWRLGGGSCKS